MMDVNLIMNIAIVWIIIISLLVLWKKGYRKQVGQIILALATQAEKRWGSGTGPIKFSEVYSKLPVIVTMLYSYPEISEMIEEAVKDMKAYIESNLEVRSKIGV